LSTITTRSRNEEKTGADKKTSTAEAQHFLPLIFQAGKECGKAVNFRIDECFGWAAAVSFVIYSFGSPRNRGLLFGYTI
jgi:hypothetical protein